MDDILIGSSCSGLGKTKKECEVDELRQVRGDYHPDFWPQINFCLSKGTPIYLNFDSWAEKHEDRGWKSEDELRNFVKKIIIEYERRVIDKSLNIYRVRNNTLLILDNEYEEVPGASIGGYIKWLKIFRDQIGGRYEIGAGNFSSHRIYMPWYRELCKHKDLFDVLCIHLQAGFENIKNMEKNYKVYRDMIRDFGIRRVTCTEGVYPEWDLSRDFYLVEKQIEIAKKLDCEGYCAVFIDATHPMVLKKWLNIIFSRYPEAWKKFVKLIQENKPMEEEDMFKLEEFYYWRKLHYRRDPDCRGVELIQEAMNRHMDQKLDGEDFTIGQAFENYNKKYCEPESPNYEGARSKLIWDGTAWFLKVDGVFGEKTAAVVEEYQRFKGIDVDGIVGPMTFDNIMDDNSNVFMKMLLEWMRVS